MLSELKFDLCFAFNTFTETIGAREISRSTGVSLTVVSRIKNYKVDELTVESLIKAISHFRSVILHVNRDVEHIGNN